MISLIATLSSNRVIGIKNTIPWTLPEDLIWFKRNTLNKPVIMGRLTLESIGHSLPRRKNIVVSRQSILMEDIICVNSLNAALDNARNAKEIMIIGGSQIYEQMLESADRLYLTHVNSDIDGDAYFPRYKLENWKSIFKEFHRQDERHLHSFCFEILDRR